MNIYQTDFDGYFVATVQADPDPMVEGNFLIPAGCVTEAPPEFNEGQRVKWMGDAWQVEDIPTPPAPTIDMVRAQAVAAMEAWIAAFLSQFTAGVLAAELASWPVKAERARAHLGGAPQAMIIAEAAITGEDPDALAQKIVAKADAYEAIIARVTGLRRATEAAIGEAETAEAVAAVLTAARAQAEAMVASLGIGSAPS